MSTAAQTSNSGLNGDVGAGFEGLFDEFEDGGDVSIDFDSFFQILKEETPDPSLSNTLHQSMETAHERGLTMGVEDCDKSMCQRDELNLSFSGGISENSNEAMEMFRKHPCSSPAEISLVEANQVSPSGTCSESGVSHVPEPDYIDNNSYAAMVQSWSEGHDVDDFMTQSLPISGNMLNYEKNEIDNLQPLLSYLDQIALPASEFRSSEKSITDVPTIDFFGQSAVVQDNKNGYFVHPNTAVQDIKSGYLVDPAGIDFLNGISSTTDAVSEHFMPEKQLVKKEDTVGEFLFPIAMNYQLCEEGENKDYSQKVSFAYADGNFADNMLAMFPGNQRLVVSKKEEDEVCVSSRLHPSQDLYDKYMHLSLEPARNTFPVFGGLDSLDPSSVKKELNTNFVSMAVKSTELQPEGCQISSPYCGSDTDDLYILEDVSQNRQMFPLLSPQSCTTTLNQLIPRTPENDVSVGGTKLMPRDERQIRRAALRDLSQPTMEANPPERSLAVSLLRHQRIALHWMVQKETAGGPCSGGILADDQGLGKTISTIALIVTEKPSSRRNPVTEKVELETLDVDGDDDQLSNSDAVKKNDIDLGRNRNQMKKNNTSSLSGGRPAAGTLIVCPTSVMRQWAEELRTKVASESNVSVLVYHGSNRTKDPHELAKYDVVLTTYSIVSMEVPKQPHKEKDGNKRNLEPDNALHLSSSKKRKCPPSSDKRPLKRGMGDALPELTVHPLARLRWFRVVLDEAQSIKNHKTRVAQACWGLRAKRRWCLSGTPIQNAVDDLYSYFRFLKYDPYDVYQSFCSLIKAPIGKSPARGYKKLQAILKTIMLRRTKGTLLDGEPIINLPPKTVELMKVEFSKEERDFYSKLEADSRSKFQDYAASGTVQQNYVNILLLLLRLRQACDHPLLVHGHDSSAVWKSSVNEAKKLSLEKLHSLISCLEASLAICGRCNDPPEDAVVSICGHVFCNQCISEHLTGDNNQCPASNCKVQLNSISVFSGAVLKCCLPDQTSVTSVDGLSGSHQSNSREVADPLLGGGLSESSKVKTALKILNSLSKPQDFMENTCPTEHNDSGPSSSDSSQSRGKNPDSSALTKEAKATSSNVSEKAIVFSQWTRMLDLLESGLKESTLQYRRLDGTMTVAARDKAVRDFNTLPEVTVMIMSLKAASLGLNMVAACRVLLLDPWWNPTTEDQAIDRAHRIGQTRPVTVFRLTVKDTVEDRILALQLKKRELVASAFGEDKTGRRQTRLTVEDLNYLFMRSVVNPHPKQTITTSQFH
ncbi:hypothetical protein V2J09_018900 [Rumex salicifolius]